MIIYKPLPLEILVIIFRHLRSAVELGECRLVCKAWNDPAETAMFSKPLIVYHEEKAEKVIRHLERNPAKGRYITNLTVADFEDQRVMKRLLQLAFTPSIERANGSVLDSFYNVVRLSTIYTTMIEIAENSPIKFDRLTIIPDTLALDDLYNKALLTFRETLEVVRLDVFSHDGNSQDVLHRFDEFKNLKVLHLDEGDFNNMQEFDAVLKGCHHLKELYLSVEISDQTEIPDQTEIANSTAIWEQMQVEREPSLEKLVFASPDYPLLLDYLLYKYPSIQDLKLGPKTMMEPDLDYNITSLDFERILGNMKRLKKYSFNFMMFPEDDLNEKFTAAKGDLNSLTIQYPTQFVGNESIIIHLDVDTLENKTRKTHFFLQVPMTAASFSPIDLVRKAGIPLERLELDFVNCAATDGDAFFSQQQYRSEEGAAFFDTMYEFPHIKEMKLTAHYLSKASGMFSTHNAIELRLLEVCGAEVTQNALQCISKECPQLKELKLVNCYLVPDDRQNTFHIRMHRTSFDHFTYTIVPAQEIIQDKEDYGAIDHFGLIFRKMYDIWARPSIYLWLGIKEAGKKIYFVISALSSNEEDLSVCQEIFDLRPVKEAPLIHFTCSNIKSLRIQLGSVSFVIKEDLIRKYVESSFMSYPLEKGDINDGEEKEEEG